MEMNRSTEKWLTFAGVMKNVQDILDLPVVLGRHFGMFLTMMQSSLKYGNERWYFVTQQS
jgi:hypothetical protein